MSPGDPFDAEYRVQVQGDRFYNPKTGSTWREIDRGNGRVTRIYEDGSPFRFAANVGATVRLAPTAQTPAVTATPAPTPKPAKPRPIRRSAGRGHVEVAIHPGVVSNIRRAIQWGIDPNDFRELGGWLIGTWTGDRVEIVDATTSASKRQYASMRLNLHDWDFEMVKREWGHSVGPIGSWHTHLNNGTPSTTDFLSFEDAWRHIREVEGRYEPYTANLIVVLEGGSRSDLTASTYVTTRENDQMVTEPALAVL